MFVRRNLFLLDGEELAGGATPPETAETTPAPAAPAPAPSSPWAQDLEQFFPDETVRAEADRFLREKIQPYTTRLEQDSAPARALYKDLVDNPQETLGALVAEIYGTEEAPNEELAQKVLELIAGGATPEEAAQQVSENQTQLPIEREPAPALAPDDRQALDEWKAQRQEEAYENALSQLREQTGAQFTREEISPFVVSAEGDLEKGFQLYQAAVAAQEAAFKAKYGITDPAPEQPPAALGTTTTGDGGTPPPVAESYGSFDEALDAFTSEIKAKSAPTVVGTV